MTAELVDISSSTKPDDEHLIEVEIPAGWRRVWRGWLLPGDYYLNLEDAQCGRIIWMPVDFPLPKVRNHIYEKADAYGCVIREGSDGPDKPCERCRYRVARFNHRFCEDCCNVIKETKSG